MVYTLAKLLLFVYLNNTSVPFGVEICWDTCPRTLSSPRSEQFSKSACRSRKNCELWGTDNVQGRKFIVQSCQRQLSEHTFLPNRGYCVYYPLKFFAQHAQFWKLANITRIFTSFSQTIFSHVTCLDQLRASENISRIYKWLVTFSMVYHSKTLHH